jgi:hypothetical protein
MRVFISHSDKAKICYVNIDVDVSKSYVEVEDAMPDVNEVLLDDMHGTSFSQLLHELGLLEDVPGVVDVRGHGAHHLVEYDQVVQ